jgi:hypothetical protein
VQGSQGGAGGAACMYNTPKYLLLEILDKGEGGYPGMLQQIIIFFYINLI